MAGLDDFIKGAKLLQGALQERAVLNAVDRAKQEVQQVNQTLEGELLTPEERSSALQQVSNNLTLDLARAGAPASTIQTLAGQLGQTPQQRAQTDLQQQQLDLQSQRLEQNQSQFKESQRAQDRRAEQAIKKAQRTQLRQRSSEERRTINSKQKEFNSLSRDSFKALDQATSAERSLSAKNPVADSAIKTLLAKASGEVGNLTEAEREMFAGSPALTQRAGRLLRLQGVGTLPESDRKDLQELIQIYQENARRAIRSKADLISGQATKTTGLSKEDALRAILPDADRTLGAPAPAVNQEAQPTPQSQPVGGGLNQYFIK